MKISKSETKINHNSTGAGNTADEALRKTGRNVGITMKDSYFQKLKIISAAEDPQHGLTLSGVNQAVDWLNALSGYEVDELICELEGELNDMSDKQLIQLIMISKQAKSAQLNQLLSHFVINNRDSLTPKVLTYADSILQI